jgi:hypothetical protein
LGRKALKILEFKAGSVAECRWEEAGLIVGNIPLRGGNLKDGRRFCCKTTEVFLDKSEQFAYI